MAGLWTAALSVLLVAGCGPSGQETPPESPTLARVGDRSVRAVDFASALDRLAASSGDEAADIEVWRQRFQLLIDKELLLLEARSLGLEKDNEVRTRVQGWSRAHLTEALVGTLMADRLRWDEEQLRSFFARRGGDRAARLWRLAVTDRQAALDLLTRARKEGLQALGAAEDLGWVSPLSAADGRLAALAVNEAGSVELVEGPEGLSLVEVTEVRSVAFEAARAEAERALGAERRNEANMALVERLTGDYQVRLDTAAVSALAAAGDVQRVNPEMLLVRSSLGDWKVADLATALEDLPAAQRQLPADRTALGFQVTRAYIVSLLLEDAARNNGLSDEYERRRRLVAEEEMVDVLWRREGLSKVSVSQAEMRAYYEARKGRYAGLERAALGRRVERDLREEKAAPYFEEYLERLRQRYADRVEVDEEALRAFIADKRRAEAPVDM